ncbi:MAG: cation ABC transporter substrate-binding protein, partial [Candidatus Zixiibacteriota bacterium]
MITKIIIQTTLFCLMLIGSNTVADSSINESSQKSQIYVSVPPLAFFVEKIAGDNFDVITVIGPGQSPATLEITPKQLAEFSKTKIFFTAGVPFEKHLNKKLKDNFKNLNIIDTQKGIDLQKIEHHHHDNIKEDETDETESLDPHSWLDPSLAKIMSQNICDGLTRFYPADSLLYQNNLHLLLEDLDKLDLYVKRELKPYSGKSFYTFHPAFGYFARVYGLKQIAIEIDGKEPSARQLADIIKKA